MTAQTTSSSTSKEREREEASERERERDVSTMSTIMVSVKPTKGGTAIQLCILMGKIVASLFKIQNITDKIIPKWS